MTMSATVSPAKPARGRGPADGRAFFETLWRGGNFLLDRQKVQLRRSRKRRLHHAAANNGGKRKHQQQQQQQQQQLLQMQRQHCCCCQRIQLHLLAGRRSNVRSVVR
ncbi:serine arginine repetitive matrix protein 2 isoform x2 [Lasius niger]|uniref:Serine arginine repetitive matrix protein 2 isoform x2 n=1 Tax=Lasius niger TaxID=67767 RepID=A0A0J7KXE6_LASNI|nr:serine arginine repetitive matrix protein 2 isoform x2 [Lasius niger]